MNTITSLYKIPATHQEDLAQLRLVIEQFKAGEIPAARFQAIRVPQGIYEQRENGTYMLRVRLPAGLILPGQMRAVAQVAQRYGNSELHLTSRQDIQVHRVALEAIYPSLVELASAGLSTKGGGGNTVRNIAACHLAGVCPHETFDITPHVVGLTEFLLPDPLSYQLPRKYKIAFSGCDRDCAAATVNDLGFISKIHDGVEGFAVYVGGGMGSSSRVGMLLEEFIPAGRIYQVAEAVKRVFDQHGNRKNRHRARLRFLVEELGIEQFTVLYRAELDGIDPISLETPAWAAPTPAITDTVPEPHVGYTDWKQAHVHAQKQAGYGTVEIAPRLGVLNAEQLLALADIIERYGERMLRVTNWQGALLRWVPDAQLPAIHAELVHIGLGAVQPPLLRRMVTCAGAATCRLGICLSRGLAQAIVSRLAGEDIDLSGGTGDVSLHISGCPNACGRHPLAQIGFYGAARRVNRRLVPHYVMQLGGVVEEGHTTLAHGSTAIPARNIPALLVDLLQAFHASPEHPDFPAFLAAGGRQTAEEIAQRHQHVPDFAEDKNPYYDWGASELFSLAGRGPGECGAGVFDLIAVDLASAEEAHAQGKLFSATAFAARSLLVTRGEQAETHQQALALFEQHFLQQELIAATLQPLITRALAAGLTADPETAFTATADEVDTLLAAVRQLYEGMGPSLRISAPVACRFTGVTPVVIPAAADIVIDHAVDFRGVACPLNYVKTKLALERLKTDQVLAVLLDGEGAKNVPGSAAHDGHVIVSSTAEDDHWRVLIKKA